MIKNIISRLTMVKIGESFYDSIIKKKVYYWQDYEFNCYIATNRFGKRIKINTL